MSTQSRVCKEGSDCQADGTTLHHYFVISPEMVTYGWDEPPEHYRDVVSVDARTKREALIFGIKQPDMATWVKEARGDKTNPLFGVKVDHIGCKHRPCWCGDWDFESENCHKCFEEHVAECTVRYCWHTDPFEDSVSVKYL